MKSIPIANRRIGGGGSRYRRFPHRILWYLLLALLNILLSVIHLSRQSSEILFSSQQQQRDFITERESTAPYYNNNDLATPWRRRRKPRLGDGCYHVFLDVGANIGMHGRFLYEPQSYPESKASKFFERRFGKNRLNEDYCVFGLEPNPNHKERLETLSASYAAMGWRYTVLNVAAFDVDGNITFYHQGDSKHNEWGFSFNEEKVVRIDENEKYGSETVPTIRLSTWIQREINERIIPNVAPSGRKYKKPIVGMKLDIEQSEFVVYPDLLATGAICHFDFLYGEFHVFNTPINFPKNLEANPPVEKFTIDDRVGANTIASALKLATRLARNCPVRFRLLDDESYTHDGKSLPTPG